jgi:hypothetical protein
MQANAFAIIFIYIITAFLSSPLATNVAPIVRANTNIINGITMLINEKIKCRIKWKIIVERLCNRTFVTIEP